MKKFSAVQYLFVQSFEIIFPLFPLQSGSNLRPTSSTKAFAFEWKNLIWHFLFNLKVVAATVTISINHIRGYKWKYQADLSHACSAQGNLRVSIFHQPQAHIHTQVFKKKKKKMNKSIISVLPCVVFLLQF